MAVDEPAPRRSVHDDPAVLGVSRFSKSHQIFPNDENNTDVTTSSESAKIHVETSVAFLLTIF